MNYIFSTSHQNNKNKNDSYIKMYEIESHMKTLKKLFKNQFPRLFLDKVFLTLSNQKQKDQRNFSMLRGASRRSTDSENMKSTTLASLRNMQLLILS